MKNQEQRFPGSRLSRIEQIAEKISRKIFVLGSPPLPEYPHPSGLSGYTHLEKSKNMGRAAALSARIEEEGLESIGRN